MMDISRRSGGYKRELNPGSALPSKEIWQSPKQKPYDKVYRIEGSNFDLRKCTDIEGYYYQALIVFVSCLPISFSVEQKENSELCLHQVSGV